MKKLNIDGLQLILMLSSLVVAFMVPFRLFFLVYAILGPIHYLTEITWLRERNFFIQDKRWVWFLVLVTVVVAFPTLMFLPILSDVREIPFINELIYQIKALDNTILFTAFFFAIGLIHFRKAGQLILFLATSLVLSHLILEYLVHSYVIGIFLPTLIHVYVFTMLFMIAGTIKSKSKLGMASIGLLIVSPIAIVSFPIDPSNYLSPDTEEIMSTVRNFQFIQFLGDYFKIMENKQFIPLTAGAVKMQIFIAFAYTYHYLNWFSKTSLIGWYKDITKPQLSVIVVMWAGLVGLTFYNYGVGYTVLFGLAMLHIVFEFPLNVSSIKDIGGYFVSRVR
ncbi:MAG: hypothetical protein JKX73_02435 [Flavobacteriales bacterium]|nr:hypothetical protein [Flavobacteriales bacterium]